MNIQYSNSSLSNEIFGLHLGITENSMSTCVVSWFSRYDRDYAIEYKESCFLFSKKIKSFSINKKQLFINNYNNNFIDYVYTYRFEKLNPGTEYKYRIIYKDQKTDWFNFKTDTGKQSTILIFPDTQSHDYSIFNKLADKAFSCKNINLYFSMGDLVQFGPHRFEWEEWFKAIDKYSKSIPIAPVIGNHEYLTLEHSFAPPYTYLQLFSIPNNGDLKHKGHYYSFDYGYAHYVILDNNIEEFCKISPNMLEDEILWLENDLKYNNQKWTIVLMHQDVLQYTFKYRHNNCEQGISQVGKVFMPIFEKHKVHLVFTAHLHTYRNRGRIFNFKNSKSNGPIYIVTGVAGDEKWVGYERDVHYLDKISFEKDEGNFILLDIEYDKLNINTYNTEGEIIDNEFITK